MAGVNIIEEHPIFEEIRNNNQNAVRAYIQNHGDLTIRYNTYSLLHVAVIHNRIDICRMLINADPSLVRAVDRDGNSALHMSVIHDFPDIMQLLIDFGADVNLRNNLG